MTSLLRAWAQDKDTQLERALAVLGLSRALLLLPPDQSAFAPSTAAFTRHIPESIWGLGALALSAWVWAAASSPKNYANRRNAARALVAHSLVLFPLYALSNPWATIGWYHLLFALCAAVLTYARSSDLCFSTSSKGAEEQKHIGADMVFAPGAKVEVTPIPPSSIEGEHHICPSIFSSDFRFPTSEFPPCPTP